MNISKLFALLFILNCVYGKYYYIHLRSPELSEVHDLSSTMGISNYIQDLRRSRFDSQRGVIRTLKYYPYLNDVKQYWISNLVRVYIPPQYDENYIISVLRYIHNYDVIDVFEEKNYNVTIPISQHETNIQENWGVDKIGVRKYWEQGYTGKDIVIANIDTGVRYTHERLLSQYRGTDSRSHDYNWVDPYNDSNEPDDTNGHGTHVMGVMVEVAKDAKWIAAKGCGRFSCTTRGLLESAEYLMCPTKLDGSSPNCEMRPHIINNSWGGGQGDTWYDDIIQNWIRVGIVPVFAAGNSGPQCSTTNSPSDSRQDVLSVCATDINDNLATFSSRGPTANGVEYKPDICGPGVDIYSAWIDSDRSYKTISGTSMATPHVSGVIALLLEKEPELRYDYGRLKSKLYEMVSTDLKKTDETCGRSSVYPNVYYGYGRVELS